MATAPTAGKLYFLESDSDDWITDHAGDPDLIDLDLFTGEGTDWIQLEIPKGFTIGGFTGIVVVPGGAGSSFSFKYAARYYTTIVNATGLSLADTALIDKFVMSNRHTSSSSYKDYYLVVYFGVNNHYKFTDASSTQKSYCKGAISPNYAAQWNETEHQTFNMNFKWASIW